MSDDLTLGGDDAELPPGWVAPWGWDGRKAEGAIWTGQEPAEQTDLARLKSAGWTPDEKSLVGTFDIRWSAAQYDRKWPDLSDELHYPWDTLPKPGGEGSIRYQFKLVPRGIDKVAAPRNWVHSNGQAFRAKGGEPVHRQKSVGGHADLHLGGRPGSPAEGITELRWDAEEKLWRVPDSE